MFFPRRYLRILVPVAMTAFGASSFAETVGTVASLSGRVTANQKPLQAGGPVSPGDKIETSPSGRVKILMKDETVVDLSPNSNLEIKKYDLKNRDGRQIDIGSDQGTVRTLVNKKLEKKGRFQFHTRTSVLAVRGTEFFVQTPPGSGAVAVTVTEGNLTALLPNGLPPVTIGSDQQWAGGEALPASNREVASVTESARVVDNTFDSFVVVGSGTDGASAGRDALGTVTTTFTPSVELPVKIGDFIEARSDRQSPAQDPNNTGIINRTEYSLKVKFNP